MKKITFKIFACTSAIIISTQCNTGFLDIWQHILNIPQKIEREVKQAFDNISKHVTNVLNLPSRALRSQLASNKPYTLQNASVRRSNQLSQEEKSALEERRHQTSSALNSILIDLAIPEEKAINIACCVSGGGFRAMVATLGYLQGLQDTQLLDTVLMISALSGGAWAVGGWIASEKVLDHYIGQVRENIAKNIRLAPGKGTFQPITQPDQIADVVNNFITKFVFDEPLSSIDVWGALISNNLLQPKHNRQLITLSGQQNFHMINAPFPIYTVVTPLTDQPYRYDWIEFTPFEIGSAYQRAFIPAWAFGRQFNNGQAQPLSTTTGAIFPPEQSYSYLLGIFGSAFTANIQDAIQNLQAGGKLPTAAAPILSTLIDQDRKMLHLTNRRFIPAEINNFMYKLPNRPLSNEKTITLVDAGLDFTLPFLPLLRPERTIDVIIVFDMSATVANAPALRSAEQRARKHGFKFPTINYQLTELSPVSVFSSKNLNIPTIIYIQCNHPCLDDFCSTLNFHYSAEEFDALFDFAKQTIIDHREEIVHAFHKKQQQKLAA